MIRAVRKFRELSEGNESRPLTFEVVIDHLHGFGLENLLYFPLTRSSVTPNVTRTLHM